MKKLFAASILLAVSILALQGGSSSAKLNFEKALLLEEANGRLEEAITLYKKVVVEAGNEALAAQAQLHVGMCYEKLAKQDAKKAYQLVIDKYPSQQETVRVARERLAKLAGSSTAAKTMAVREFLRSGNFSFDKVSGPTIDPSGFVTTSDGQTFVYTDWMTGDLVVKNFSSGKTKGLYSVTWHGSTDFFLSPVLSPDDKKVAFMSWSYTKEQTYKSYVAIDGLYSGSRENLYEGQSGLHLHDWSPDGRNILVSLEAADRSISLVTLSTKDKKMQRLVTLNWEYPIRAGYSPDSRFIAYDSTKGGNRKIYLMSADGSQERLLVDSPGQNDSPLWSRDSRFLAFRSNRSGEWDLFALPMKAGEPVGDPVLIKSNIGDNSFLRSLTTDGKLFYSEQLSGPDIAIMARDASEGIKGAKILPTVNTRANSFPSFAPDGKRLAYLAGPAYGPAGKQILRITDLDGKVLSEALFGSEFGNIRRPEFSPEGNKIALLAADRKRQAKILLLSADTGKLLKVLTPQAGSSNSMTGLGWSRDSRLVYVTVGWGEEAKGPRLETIDIETENVTSVPLRQTDSHGLSAMSPDGKYFARMVVTRSAPGQQPQNELVLHSVIDGTNRAFKKDAWLHPLVWDFDSRHIFYQKPMGPPQLYRMSLETGEEVVFLEDCKDFWIASVSPDGKLFALQSKKPAEARIWVVENFLPKAKAQVAGR